MCPVDVTSLLQLVKRSGGRKGTVFLDQFPTVYPIKTDLILRSPNYS